MTLRGSVETIGLVDLLQLIQGNGHSGTLKVVAGESTSRLYFFKGQLYLPTGGAGGALKIGALLVRARKITGKDLLRALQLQAAGGGAEKLGEVLVREGLIEKEEHDAVVRRLYEEEIYDLLFREGAYFEWKRDVLPAGFMDTKGNVRALHFDTRSILMEASRRQDEWRRVRARVPTTKAIYRLTYPDEPALEESEGVIEADSAAASRLPPDEKVVAKVLDALGKEGAVLEECPFDGARNLEDVITLTNLTPFEALRVVTQLRDENLVRPISAPEIEPRALVALKERRFTDAFKLYAWANEIERLRRIAGSLDKELLQPENLHGAGRPAFAGRTGGARALQILSRLLRRGSPFQLSAREEESAIDVYATGRLLRLHLMGPRRTHSAVRYLKARGFITEDDLKRARETAKVKGRELDRVLLEERMVTREQWLLAVKDKVVSALFSIFEWSDPFLEVSGDPQLPPSDDEQRGLVVEIPLDDVLREDLRKDLLRWKAILEAVPSPDVIFVCPKPRADGPKHLQDLLDGRRNVADLLALAKVAPLELVRFLLEALLGRRIRRLSDKEHRDRLDQAVAAGRLDDAIAFAKSAIAFGYSPDGYRRKTLELRERRKGMPSAEGRPTVQGELGHVSLAEVLQLLHGGKRSGTLRISAGLREGAPMEKTLYLDQGEIYILNVEGPAPDSELQELLGESAVDRLGMNALIQAKRGSSVNEDQIAKTEIDRIKNDIFEAFLWEGARFEFLQNFLPPELRAPAPNATKLALKTEGLLFDAMQRLAEWDELRQVLKSAHAVFHFASDDAKARAVAHTDGALAHLFDGELSLADVVRRSGEDRYRVYRFAGTFVRQGILLHSHNKSVSSAESPTRRIMASGRFQTVPPPSASDEGRPLTTRSSGRAFPGLSGLERTDDSIHEMAPAPAPDARKWGAPPPGGRVGGTPPPQPLPKKTTAARPVPPEPLTPLPRVRPETPTRAEPKPAKKSGIVDARKSGTVDPKKSSIPEAKKSGSVEKKSAPAKKSSTIHKKRSGGHDAK
jgi:hypothetical protein